NPSATQRGFLFSVTFKLFHPVGNKKIGITGAAVVAVGREDEFFSIRRKHGKCIEDTLIGDLLETAAVIIDHKKLEIITSFAVMIARKNDLLSARMKKWRPIGFAQFCYLFQIASIHVTCINFHIDWSNQSLRQ